MYRDGISEGQYNDCLDKELGQIQEAIGQLGAVDPQTGELTIKVSYIVCTKRHNVRVVYETSPGQYSNPCSGLVVDASGGRDSIVSHVHNEFYLKSHATIQGTAKPTRYTLLYDEIGFKMSELELLTYWSTYLYCRCNRSVSLCTPVYYAHWAAARGRTLVSSVAQEHIGRTLDDLTDGWAHNENEAAMFFV